LCSSTRVSGHGTLLKILCIIGTYSCYHSGGGPARLLEALVGLCDACLMGKSPSFGEEFNIYETACSSGHHLKFIFAKKVLKDKLDKGEVKFFCYDCDRVWEASSEQKIELRRRALA
jgi:hypothetical protein